MFVVRCSLCDLNWLDTASGEKVVKLGSYKYNVLRQNCQLVNKIDPILQIDLNR